MRQGKGRKPATTSVAAAAAVAAAQMMEGKKAEADEKTREGERERGSERGAAGGGRLLYVVQRWDRLLHVHSLLERGSAPAAALSSPADAIAQQRRNAAAVAAAAGKRGTSISLNSMNGWSSVLVLGMHRETREREAAAAAAVLFCISPSPCGRLPRIRAVKGLTLAFSRSLPSATHAA